MKTGGLKLVKKCRCHILFEWSHIFEKKVYILVESGESFKTDKKWSFCSVFNDKNVFSHSGTLLSEGEQNNSIDKVEQKTDDNRQQQNQKPNQQQQSQQQQINENISQAKFQMCLFRPID